MCAHNSCEDDAEHNASPPTIRNHTPPLQIKSPFLSANNVSTPMDFIFDQIAHPTTLDGAPGEADIPHRA
jgi:hypothetical protein